MKKSILFIADKPDWAYHNIIKTWAELLNEEYNCYVAFAQDFFIKSKKFSRWEILKNKISLAIKSSNKKYKIHPSKTYSYPIYSENPVYEVLSQQKTNKISFDFIIEMAYYFQYISEFPFHTEKKMVGLYTDSYPHEGPSFDEKTKTNLKALSRQEFYDKYLKKYDGIIVGNANLYDDYQNFGSRIAISNGIHKESQFIENKNVGDQETLTIGWTGTPDREMKGYRSIIEPAIKELQEEGLKINLKTKFSGSYDELLSFYQDIDIVCIASSADTGPSLFAEASLSKVPSISTKIGFPKMIIQNGENGIFVGRDKEEMKSAIKKLYQDRDLLKSFSMRIKEDYLEKLNNQKSVNNLKKILHEI